MSRIQRSIDAFVEPMYPPRPRTKPIERVVAITVPDVRRGFAIRESAASRPATGEIRVAKGATRSIRACDAGEASRATDATHKPITIRIKAFPPNGGRNVKAMAATKRATP